MKDLIELWNDVGMPVISIAVMLAGIVAVAGLFKQFEKGLEGLH